MAEGRSLPVVSSSLLLNLDLNITVPREFDIGMGEWMSPPREKKARVLADATNSCRFAAPVSPTSLQNAAKGIVPANTEASTEWARKNFNAWAKSRERSGGEGVPAGLLRSHDGNLVCKWLCCFVMETRKSDGSVYPPASLRSLVSGLNRILQGNKAPFSVLDKADPCFRVLIKTLDTLTSELHRQGVGVTRNSAKVIEASHEDYFG